MKKLLKKISVILLASFSMFGTIGGLSGGEAEAAVNGTKTIKIEGKNTVVPAKGNKWVNVNGFYHFVKDGVLVKGWRHLTSADGEKTSHYSYFDKDTGRIYTGWKNLGKKEGEKTSHWSYFGPNGWLRTGWQHMGKGTNNPDGNTAKHISYFGPDGWLRTGWQRLGKGTSNPDGKTPQHWSYFGPNGWLRTGMQTMGNASNPDGKNGAHLSYFGSNGWLTVSKSFNYNGYVYRADNRGWAKKVSSLAASDNNKKYYKTVKGVKFYAASDVFTLAHTSNGKLVEEKDKIEWNSTITVSGNSGVGAKIRPDKDIKKEDLVFKVGGKNNLVLPDYVADVKGKKAVEFTSIRGGSNPNDENYVHYVNGWNNHIAKVYVKKEVLPNEKGGKRDTPPYYCFIVYSGTTTGSFPIEVYYKGELLGKFTVKNTKADNSKQVLRKKIEEAAWKKGMTKKQKVFAVADYVRDNFTYSQMDCIAGANMVVGAARDLGLKARFYYEYGKYGEYYTYSYNIIGHNSALVDFGDGKECLIDAQGEKK